MITLLTAILVSPAVAGAWYGPEAMAGFEGNLRSGYAFASLVSPSVDKRLVTVVNLGVSHLYYRYPDTGGEARVLSPGIGVGVALRWRPERLSLTLGATYEVRYTDTLNGQGERSVHADHGPGVSLTTYFQVTPRTAVGAMGFLDLAHEFLWGRALVKEEILPGTGTKVREFSVGVDATVRGNRIASEVAGGVFGELAFPGTETALTLGVGVGREVLPGAPENLRAVLKASVYKSF